jgi:putative tryptophan/tyrosine transport system substrate-binding protein
VRRRNFIALLGSAAAWPLAARAQQVPVIGFLSSASPETYSVFLAALRQGLSDAGFVEPRNCRLELRWAFDQFDRLPALAAELVGQKPAVIVTAGGLQPALAAKAATASIPIVFASVSDPVEIGLVASLNRPGGNVTGVDALLKEVNAKRLELLRAVVPQAEVIGVLVNPARADARKVTSDIETAARALGQKVTVARAASADDIDAAIADLVRQRIGALMIASDALFSSQRERLAALAARYSLPASFNLREAAAAGVLMSYGPRVSDSYRQAGLYAGRILKGERPADLPVVQPTKFELVINLKTAKALVRDAAADSPFTNQCNKRLNMVALSSSLQNVEALHDPALAFWELYPLLSFHARSEFLLQERTSFHDGFHVQGVGADLRAVSDRPV